MQRPIRSTRSKASPGLIDRPTSRRPTTVVAKEKATKKQAVASKADEQHRRAAQVAEIEKEIKQAQAEAQPVGQRGRGKVVKKTFRRPNSDVNVGPCDRNASTSSLISHCSHCLPPIQATKTDHGKRSAESADLSEPEQAMAVKVTKYVPLPDLFDTLSDCCRAAGSSYPNPRQDALSKPSRLINSVKTTIANLAAADADGDEESNEPTEDEVVDDIEYTTGSGDSLVRPPPSFLSFNLTGFSHWGQGVVS